MPFCKQNFILLGFNDRIDFAIVSAYGTIYKRNERMSQRTNRHTKEYVSRYHKKNYKQVKINFNKNKDAEIIEYLSKLDNVSGFIKFLVKEKMKEEHKE